MDFTTLELITSTDGRTVQIFTSHATGQSDYDDDDDDDDIRLRAHRSSRRHISAVEASSACIALPPLRLLRLIVKRQLVPVGRVVCAAVTSARRAAARCHAQRRSWWCRLGRVFSRRASSPVGGPNANLISRYRRAWLFGRFKSPERINLSLLGDGLEEGFVAIAEDKRTM